MNIKTSLLKITNFAFLRSGTLLLVFAFTASVLPPNVFAVVSETIAGAISTEDENFDKKFREGRDLIDKQEWKKASEKFSEVINQYPDNKSVDAALYWLAFCYKKQREFEKMGSTVDRLLKDYPSSSWTSDARVLLIEVAQPSKIITGATGQNVNIATGLGETVTVSNTYSVSKPLKPVQPLTITSIGNSFDAYAVLNGLYPSESKAPLDREDEIKLAAFQSLLAANLQKGVEAVSDILKTDSKASETLKIEVLRSLRSPRNFRVYSSTEYLTSLQPANKPINPSPSPFRDLLIKGFQNNPNVKIRREIVYALSGLRDEQSVNALAGIYKSEADLEVKKAIIHGLASSWANSNIFYGFSTSAKIGNAPFLGQSNNVQKENNSVTVAAQKPEFKKLFEIGGEEKNPELRELIFDYLIRYGSNSPLFQSTEYLSEMYDGETVESIKKTIIQGLVKINQPSATKKLLEIAKTDQSKLLRIEAVRALGQSKDPEAIKYLEEILK